MLKKVVVVLLFAIMMTVSIFTASAAISPEVPTGETETSTNPTCPQCCRRWPRRGGYDYEYGYFSGYGGYGGGSIIYTGSGGGGVTVVDMSPKTGYSNSYAVMTVAGIMMCGGIAVYSGKKMKEQK